MSVLVVRRSSLWSPSLGLALLAAALGLVVLMTRSRTAEVEPYVMGAVLALALGAGGLHLLTRRNSLIIDRVALTATEESGSFGRRRTVHDLRQRPRVELEVEWRSEEGDVFHVALRIGELRVEVGSERDEPKARRRAEELALFLEAPFHDRIRGKAVEPEQLQSRLRDLGDDARVPEPPVHVSRVFRHGRAVRFEVPAGGHFDAGLFLATLAIGAVLIGAAFHPRLLGDGRVPLPLSDRLRFVSAMACVAPALFLMSWLWRRFHRSGIEADLHEIRSYRRGVLFRSDAHRIESSQLRELAAENALLTVVGGGEVIHFGSPQMAPEELKWIRSELLNALYGEGMSGA